MNITMYLARMYFVSSLISFSPLLSMNLSSFQASSDVNAVDAGGCTKLHRACMAGEVDEVKILIDQGAHVDIKAVSGPVSYNPNTKCWHNRVATPLHWAAIAGSCEIIRYLLDAGADRDSTYECYGNTPLHLATWFGHPDCVQLLIERGACVYAKNGHGSMPIHSAAWRNKPACLAILLEHGADVNATNLTGIGNTPLYLAAKAGSRACLKMLLKQCRTLKQACDIVNQRCSNREGTVPLEAAAARYRAQICWDLMCAGAHYSDVCPSLWVYDYGPLKSFLQGIEQGLELIPSDRSGQICLLCNHEFVSNDVIIQLNAWTTCGHVFHEQCFQDHALQNFIKENWNKAFMVELVETYKAMHFDEEKIMHELEHHFRTSPLGNPGLPKACPSCAWPLTRVLGSLCVIG